MKLDDKIYDLQNEGNQLKNQKSDKPASSPSPSASVPLKTTPSENLQSASYQVESLIGCQSKLDDSWVLCDGSLLNQAEFPELALKLKEMKIKETQ